MAVVGLTGGIASGKSTVAGIFRSKGAAVFDADEAARAVLAEGGPAYRPVLERFGEQILAGDGQLDRGHLADIVFSDEEARADLEQITHPEIFRALSKDVEGYPPESLVVIEAALLFETLDRWGGPLKPDAIVVVVSRPADQLQRLMAGRGLTQSAAQARIDAQGSWAQRLEAADFVIHNSGSLPELKRAASLVWEDLKDRLRTE